MTLANKKKLTQLIKQRELLAEKLRQAYTAYTDEGYISFEIQLDKVSEAIKKITLPPVKWKHGVYDNR